VRAREIGSPEKVSDHREIGRLKSRQGPERKQAGDEIAEQAFARGECKSGRMRGEVREPVSSKTRRRRTLNIHTEREEKKDVLHEHEV
jgi:hypothetical protein